MPEIHVHVHKPVARLLQKKVADAMRRYNVEVQLPDGTKKVEKMEFPAGKEGGYGGIIKHTAQQRYPGARILQIIERGDSGKDAYYGGTELDMYSKQFRPVIDDGTKKVWIGTQLFKTQAEALAFAKKKAAEANAKTKDAGSEISTTFEKKKGYYEIRLPNGRTIKGWPLSKFIELMKSEGWENTRREDGGTVTFRAKDKARDAGATYVLKKEALLEGVQGGTRNASGTGRIVPAGTVFYKVGSGFAPWFAKNKVFNLSESDFAVTAHDARTKAQVQRELTTVRAEIAKHEAKNQAAPGHLLEWEEQLTKELKSAKDARTKAQVETELDKVSEEIEKYEDRGVTVPANLRLKMQALQKEYKAVVEAAKRDFRASKDSKPSCCKACADAKATKDAVSETEAHARAAKTQSVDPKFGWAQPQRFVVGGKSFQVDFDGKYFRAGMMRSTTLQGLLSLIEKKVQ